MKDRLDGSVISGSRDYSDGGRVLALLSATFFDPTPYAADLRPTSSNLDLETCNNYQNQGALPWLLGVVILGHTFKIAQGTRKPKSLKQ